MISKEQILARRPSRIEAVLMPEWEGTAYVREMSAAERDAFEANQISQRKEGKDLLHFRAKMVARTVCDVSGARMFSDDEVESVSALPITEVDRLFQVALKLNALTPKDVEDISKNS